MYLPMNFFPPKISLTYHGGAWKSMKLGVTLIINCYELCCKPYINICRIQFCDNQFSRFYFRWWYFASKSYFLDSETHNLVVFFSKCQGHIVVKQKRTTAYNFLFFLSKELVGNFFLKSRNLYQNNRPFFVLKTKEINQIVKSMNPSKRGNLKNL